MIKTIYRSANGDQDVILLCDGRHIMLTGALRNLLKPRLLENVVGGKYLPELMDRGSGYEGSTDATIEDVAEAGEGFYVVTLREGVLPGFQISSSELRTLIDR